MSLPVLLGLAVLAFILLCVVVAAMNPHSGSELFPQRAERDMERTMDNDAEDLQSMLAKHNENRRKLGLSEQTAKDLGDEQQQLSDAGKKTGNDVWDSY